MTIVEDALIEAGIVEQPSKSVAQKNDPPLAPIGPYSHGPNGLFNRRDRDNPVFSAVMTPNMGVADAIPVFNGARFLNNEFGGVDAGFDSLVTGVTEGALDEFENQPLTACADGPVGGLMKFCTIVNTYGNYVMSTREVDIDRAGRVTDMTDAFTVQLANQFPSGLFATPTDYPSMQNAVNNELAMRTWEMILSFQRMIAPRVFVGSPANNEGEKKDIVGLDIHINSGNKIDSGQQATCTAANSKVLSFNSGIVGSASAGNIVALMEAADAFATYKARRQGLGTPEYIVGMRPELWQEISEIIPAQKYERVIAVINRVTNGRANLDASGVYNERDAIRVSHLIPINGRFLRVVEDDAIAETNIGNVSGVPAYTSTIYGIPLTVLGGFPVTFWEWWNHANAQSMAMQARTSGLTWVTDGGMFRWHSEFNKGCLKLNAKFKPRLRMRTPQLAWRINNVGYAPLVHFDSWDPDSTYFVDGGVQQGDNPKYYSAWNPTTPQPIW